MANEFVARKGLISEGNLYAQQEAHLRGNAFVYQTIGSTDFASGFAGYGVKVQQDAQGKWALDLDSLTVRGRMRIYELLINQIKATNGSVFVSSTGKVDTVSINTVEEITNDLLGHWTFDGNALDYSAYKNNAVLGSSSTYTTNAIIGTQSLTRSNSTGTTTYIPLANSPLLGLSQFTMSFWIYNSDLEDYDDVFVLATEGGSSLFKMETGVTDTQFQFVGASGFFADGSVISGINTNVWTLITIVADGTNVKIYENAGLVNTFAQTASFPANAYRLYLQGDIASGVSEINPSPLSDLRFYGRALTETEVTALYNLSTQEVYPSSGLAAYYNFNDAGTVNAVDYSGNGYTATLVGSPTIIDGVVGKAFKTTSNAQYFAATGMNTKFTGNQATTVSAWVKKKATILAGSGFWGIGTNSSLQGITNWNHTTADAISIDLWGTCTYQATGQTYPLDTWVHVTWVYYGTAFTTANCAIFVDGVKYTGAGLTALRGTTGTLAYQANAELCVGKIHSVGANPGASVEIEDFRIYNRALSDSEVAALYNNRGGIELTTPDDANHGFLVGDLIRSQRFTGNDVYKSDLVVSYSAGLNKFYVEPISLTNPSIDLPRPGYEYVRLGNVYNTSRQGAVYLTADDSGAPFIDVIDGINSFAAFNIVDTNKARLGKLDGITDLTVGLAASNGLYGLYTGSLYAKGNLVVGGSVSPIALSASTIAIGNVTGTANSAIKIANTGTPLTSGIFGYGSSSNEVFALRLNNTASIAGWSFDNQALYTGTKVTVSGYSGANGDITISSAIGISTRNFYVDLSGNAFFKGDISAASGNFTGQLSVGSTPNWFRVDATGNIWSGKDTYANATNASTGTFAVSNAGALFAASGTIAGWTISASAISRNSKIFLGNSLSGSETTSAAFFGFWGNNADPIARVRGANGEAAYIYSETNGAYFRAHPPTSTTGANVVVGNLTRYLSGNPVRYGIKVYHGADTSTPHFAVYTDNAGGNAVAVIAGWNFTTSALSTTGITLTSGGSASIALGAATSVSAGQGAWLDGAGNFRVGTATAGANYLHFDNTSSALTIKAGTFDLLTTGTNKVGVSGTRIALGATLPTAYNSGTGFFVANTGAFLAGNAAGNRIQWSGSEVTVVATNAQINGTSGWLGASNILFWTADVVRVGGFYMSASQLWGGNATVGNAATTLLIDTSTGATGKIALGGTASTISMTVGTGVLMLGDGKFKAGIADTTGIFWTGTNFQVRSGGNTNNILDVSASGVTLAGWHADTASLWSGNAAIGNAATNIVFTQSATAANAKIALGATANSIAIDGIQPGVIFTGDGHGRIGSISTNGVSGNFTGGNSIVDTFTGSSVNLTRWQFNGTSTATITEGALRLVSNVDANWRVMAAKKSFLRSKNATFEVNIKILTAVTQVRFFAGFVKTQGATTYTDSAGLAYINENGLFAVYEGAGNTTVAASGAWTAGDTLRIRVKLTTTGIQYTLWKNGNFNTSTYSGSYGTGTTETVYPAIMAYHSTPRFEVYSASAWDDDSLGAFDISGGGTFGFISDSGNQFLYTTQGITLKSSNAVIDGIGGWLGATDIIRWTGGTVNLANWAITSSSIQTGAFDTVSTMYFGTSGISLSNTFKVTAAGALTSTSGAIGGFTIGSASLSSGSVTTGTGGNNFRVAINNDFLGGAGNEIYKDTFRSRGLTTQFHNAGVHNGFLQVGQLFTVASNVATASTYYGLEMRYGASAGQLAFKLSANSTGTSTDVDNKIAGWSFDSTKIWGGSGSAFSGLIQGTGTTKAFFAGATAADGTGAKIYLNADGSGALAGGSISWTNAGAMTLTNNFTSTATITGGTIQTAASGARVVLGASGIQGYDATTQRYLLSNTGSGWLGASNIISWTTDGTVTIGAWSVNSTSIQTEVGDITIGMLGSTNQAIRVYNNATTAASKFRWLGMGKVFDGTNYTDSYGFAVVKRNAANNAYEYLIRISTDNTTEIATIAGWNFNATQFSSTNLSGGGNGIFTTAGILINSGGYISAPSFALGTSVSKLAGFTFDTLKLSIAGVSPAPNIYIGNNTAVWADNNMYVGPIAATSNLIGVRSASGVRAGVFSNFVTDTWRTFVGVYGATAPQAALIMGELDGAIGGLSGLTGKTGFRAGVGSSEYFRVAAATSGGSGEAFIAGWNFDSANLWNYDSTGGLALTTSGGGSLKLYKDAGVTSVLDITRSTTIPSLSSYYTTIVTDTLQLGPVYSTWPTISSDQTTSYDSGNTEYKGYIFQWVQGKLNVTVNGTSMMFTLKIQGSDDNVNFSDLATMGSGSSSLDGSTRTISISGLDGEVLSTALTTSNDTYTAPNITSIKSLITNKRYIRIYLYNNNVPSNNLTLTLDFVIKKFTPYTNINPTGFNIYSSDTRFFKVDAGGILVNTNLTILSGNTVSFNGLSSSGSGTALYINSDNNLVKYSSSARYKRNIFDLSTEFDLDKYFKLEPKVFNYLSDRQKTYGLIAEEVEKTYRHFVVYDQEGKPDAIKYNDMITANFAAIKHIYSETDLLKQKVKNLEREVLFLREKLENID